MEADEFSQRIEAAYREALKGADDIKAQSERLLAAAEADREAARTERAAAEGEGRRRAQEALAREEKALGQALLDQWRRGLVQRHVQAGRPEAEIMAWLEVEADFIEEVSRGMKPADRPGAKAGDAGLPEAARVSTTQEGRGGTVWFESATAKFDVWWEFAGGNALVIVELPTPKHWLARTGLPPEQRTAVAEFIGQQLVEQHAQGGSYVVGHDMLTLYSAGRRPV